MHYQTQFSNKKQNKTKQKKLFFAGVRGLTEFLLQIILRDVERNWSGLSLQKAGDQLLEDKECGKHSALGGKQIQKMCLFWSVHANVSLCCSRSLQWYFGASKKCTMGVLLLSVPVDSQMSQCLVTSLHAWNHAWERKLDEVHTYFTVKQEAQEGF